MPHSSGGGSHGGGSHGGSHSHSSGGGGGGSSRSRVSTVKFAGSSRYVYYGRNHTPHYIYCSKNPRKEYRPRWGLIIIYLPFLYALYLMFTTQLIHIPHKITNNYYKEIVIEDSANVITDEEALKTALKEFYDESGVTPAVVTLFNEEWNQHYKTLEKYAYDKYLNMFSDEFHWLIVYSIPQNTTSYDFTDWYWEGMIGNHVSSMITQKDEDFLTATMQRNLTASSRFSVEQAISKTFAETLENAKKTTVEWSMLPMMLFFLAFIVFHMMMMVGLTPKSLKYWHAKPAPEEPKEIVRQSIVETMIECRYCGGTFTPRENDMSCPNCGARVDMEQINVYRR